MYLRELIYSVAADTQGVGLLQETLKWGQPSYLTAETRSGTTIRIDQFKSNQSDYAMYFHCQTKLVDLFREMYPREFNYSGNRAILFGVTDAIPAQELRHCIALALSYHRNKKLKSK